MTEFKLNEPGFLSQMKDGLAKPDLELICSDGVIWTHRIVICNVSKYIMTMLDDQPTWYPTSISLPDFTKEIIMPLVDLSYNGKMNFSQDLMEPVIEAMQTLGFVHTDCLSCQYHNDEGQVDDTVKELNQTKEGIQIQCHSSKTDNLDSSTNTNNNVCLPETQDVDSTSKSKPAELNSISTTLANSVADPPKKGNTEVRRRGRRPRVARPEVESKNQSTSKIAESHEKYDGETNRPQNGRRKTRKSTNKKPAEVVEEIVLSDTADESPSDQSISKPQDGKEDCGKQTKLFPIFQRLSQGKGNDTSPKSEAYKTAEKIERRNSDKNANLKKTPRKFKKAKTESPKKVVKPMSISAIEMFLESATATTPKKTSQMESGGCTASEEMTIANEKENQTQADSGSTEINKVQGSPRVCTPAKRRLSRLVNETITTEKSSPRLRPRTPKKIAEDDNKTSTTSVAVVEQNSVVSTSNNSQDAKSDCVETSETNSNSSCNTPVKRRGRPPRVLETSKDKETIREDRKRKVSAKEDDVPKDSEIKTRKQRNLRSSMAPSQENDA